MSEPSPDSSPAAGRRKRGAERDEEARAALQPLSEGERPKAVTVAAILAALLGTANLVAAIAGVEVNGETPGVGGVAFFVVAMYALAFFMWRGNYVAVVIFEALLAITIVIAGLSLAVASNLAAVLLCLVIVLPCGYLFWKLIRAMARLQMPRQPSDSLESDG